MAQSLQEQHPDIVRVSKKWGRFQHHVDYSRFTSNQLKLRVDAQIAEGINDYEMSLEIDEARDMSDFLNLEIQNGKTVKQAMKTWKESGFVAK